MAKRRAPRTAGGAPAAGGPAAAAATAAPTMAANSQEPHYRLFTCQRARKLKGTVEWRYRDDGGTQGPFSPDDMMKLFAQKRINADTVIVGSNPDVKYPNLPGTKFYKPLSELLAMVTAGGHYEPCTKEDVKKGRPEAGWNEGGGGGGAAGAAAPGAGVSELPGGNQAAGSRQAGNKGGSTDRSHHQPHEVNGHAIHERHTQGGGRGPRNFNQQHGRHGPGGRHGRNQHHFTPHVRDNHPRNPAEIPPHMQPGAVVTRWPAKTKGSDQADGSNTAGTPSKSSEDGSSVKGGMHIGSLNTSQAGSNLLGNHPTNIALANGHLGGGHLGGGPLKPAGRDLLHGLHNLHAHHMGGLGGGAAGMLHPDVLQNLAAGRGMLQPSALLGGGMPQHGFNPIVGAAHLGGQNGLLQPAGGAAHQFGGLGLPFNGSGGMHHPHHHHHPLLQPRIKPELQQVLTANSDNPKDFPNWWFLDSYGQVQGPHTPEEMLGWFVEGHIHPSSMVCSTTQDVVRPFSPGAQLFWPLSHLLELAGKGILRKQLTFMDLQQSQLSQPASQQPQQQHASQQLGSLLGAASGAMGGSPLMHHPLMQHGLGGQMRVDHPSLFGRSLLLNSLNAARPQTPGQPNPAATSLAAAAAAAAAAGQRPVFNLAAQVQQLGLQSPASTPSAAQLAFQAQLPQMSLPQMSLPQMSLPPQAAAQLANLGSHIQASLAANGPQMNLPQPSAALQQAQASMGVSMAPALSLPMNLAVSGPTLGSAAAATATGAADAPVTDPSVPAALSQQQEGVSVGGASGAMAPAGPMPAAMLDMSKLAVSAAN